ncbi:MAG: OmpA family protein [Chitinophagales bacterium]
MKKLILLIVPILFFGISTAQNTQEFALKDSSNLCKRNYMRQYDYENNISPFAPKKKSNWAVGFDIGMPIISGDFAPTGKSIGASLKVRKGITSFFSVRYQGLFLQAKGQDINTRIVNGNNVYANYKTRMFDNTLQAVFSVGNVNRNKRQSKVIFNFFVGGGATTAFSQADYYDENATLYDYSDIANQETWGDRFFVRHQLNQLQDGKYETNSTPKNTDYPMIKDTRILPTLVLGGGIDVYLSKRIDLALEYRHSRHFDDYLDGVYAGRNNDVLHYLSAGLNFKIGKREEPTYWQNPVANNYDDVAELKRNVSPEFIGEKVDEKLNSIDLDKDGVPDYRDAETGTPLGATVDATGKAIDSDNDGVADYKDEEANTPAEAQADALGRTIKLVTSTPTNNTSSVAQDNIRWNVFFNSGASTLTKEYNAVILDVASFLLSYPHRTADISGYADSSSNDAFNLELSKKRANYVKQQLVSLGVNADRLNVNYYGEAEATGTSKVNRRVSIVVE